MLGVVAMVLVPLVDSYIIAVVNVFAFVIVLFILGQSPWRKLLAKNVRQHLWIASVVLLTVFWYFFSINIENHFAFHPLLITTLTLIFGFSLGQMAALISLIVSSIAMSIPWVNLGWNYLMAILMPGLITTLVADLVERRRIQNLFLYTLGCGFFGGMLSIVITGATNSGLYYLLGLPQKELLLDNFYVYLLLTFPEGFCNGTIVSAMAIMAPNLVKTYDDDFYLK